MRHTKSSVLPTLMPAAREPSWRTLIVLYVTKSDGAEERCAGLVTCADDCIAPWGFGVRMECAFGECVPHRSTRSSSVCNARNRQIPTVDDLSRVTGRRCSTRNFPCELSVGSCGQPFSVIRCDIDAPHRNKHAGRNQVTVTGRMLGIGAA